MLRPSISPVPTDADRDPGTHPPYENWASWPQIEPLRFAFLVAGVVGTSYKGFPPKKSDFSGFFFGFFSICSPTFLHSKNIFIRQLSTYVYIYLIYVNGSPGCRTIFISWDAARLPGVTNKEGGFPRSQHIPRIF